MKLQNAILITAAIFGGVISCTDKTSDNMTGSSRSRQVKDPPVKAFADINGLRMYYEIHGRGFPLVLIHGGGSTIETTFGRVLHHLAANHRVITVEMQAHGRTSDRDQPLSFKQDAGDIAAFMDYLQIEKANIFGFSNGASTTLQLAVDHPGKVSKIIVASTFFEKAGAPAWFWKAMSDPSFEQMPQAYKDAFLSVNPDSSALRQMYERDVARMKDFPELTRSQVNGIKAPALIIAGEQDVVLPAHAQEMQSLIAGSQLAILPGGHGDYIGELSRPVDTVLISSTVSMINTFLQKGAADHSWSEK